MRQNILVNKMFDFPAGWYLFYLGGSVLLFVLIAFIIVLEALVLHWFRYGSFRRSLGASFLMNIFSSILGFFAASFVEHSPVGVPGYYGGVPEIVEWYLFSESIQLPGRFPATVLFLLISWAISVVSEGGILVLLRSDNLAKSIWLMTLGANVMSYILLLSPYLGILLVPNFRPYLIATLTSFIILPFSTIIYFQLYWPILIIIGLFSSLFMWGQARRGKREARSRQVVNRR